MLDDWTWLNLLGGLAQIVGLLVAMRGVHKLKAEAFPDLSSPADNQGVICISPTTGSPANTAKQPK